ncbi:MAG: hypothetical protein ACRES5_13230 [Pseudomonas sp.]
MSKITVVSGDFLTGDAEYDGRSFTLKATLNPSRSLRVPVSRLKALESATEELVYDRGSAIRWGLAGALLLGPVGLVAGLLLCNTRRDVTFYANLKDGRSFLAVTDSETFSEISAATLQ